MFKELHPSDEFFYEGCLHIRIIPMGYQFVEALTRNAINQVDGTAILLTPNTEVEILSTI